VYLYAKSNPTGDNKKIGTPYLIPVFGL